MRLKYAIIQAQMKYENNMNLRKEQKKLQKSQEDLKNNKTETDRKKLAWHISIFHNHNLRNQEKYEYYEEKQLDSMQMNTI